MNTESQILNVPIEDIIPNRFQPRLAFDENGLNELADSIKEHGIIQPLVLRRLGDKYEIIAGERRYKASKIAGLTSVPAIISNITDEKSAEVAIVENVQRRDLSSIEEAKSYKALLDKGYLTQEELAKKMGLSQSAISNKLRLLSLSNSIQDALMEEKISERHARSLLQLNTHEEQDKWLSKIIDERLTVRELDKRLKMEKKEEKMEEKDELEIVVPNVVQNMEKETSENSGTSIPNKFFNFLEDEQANMNTLDIPTLEEEKEEEIEMLDFLSPSEEVKPIKNIDIVNNSIEKVISELKSMDYEISFLKDENTNEIKYIITVNKN